MCTRVYMYTCLTHLALPHDGLAAGVPVPEQHSAVLTPAHDVAVAGVVTLGPEHELDNQPCQHFPGLTSPDR